MAIDQLMQRFAAFVRERPKLSHAPAEDAPSPAFAADLAHIRDICGHHIIPLMLLSRADGESAEAERKAIVDYCASQLRHAGADVGPRELALLREYVATARPSMLQFDPALKKVVAEGIDAVHRLMGAAILVLEADGRRDPAEIDVLNALSEELAHLRR